MHDRIGRGYGPDPERGAADFALGLSQAWVFGFAGRSLMDPKWSDDLPIYRQLKDRVIAMILEGVLVDGDALPSVRNVAAEYRLNPLTVLKGYQELVDEGLVEKKRGRGMYVMEGAQSKLLKGERKRFIDKEWPQVRATIDRLGLDVHELLADTKAAQKSGDSDD